MKKLVFAIIAISVFLVSCNKSEKKENIVEQYIEAYNNRDFAKIKDIVDDSIKLVNYHGYFEATNKNDFFNIAVEWGDLFWVKI
jgi:hypothetical protein